MASGADTARARWELENAVAPAPAADADAWYRYDATAAATVQQQRPWQKDPTYFKHVRMSALALLKIAIHARSGGSLEVMGLMQGKVEGDTFIVLDAFALPVEGTETRVNAQAEAYEYMVDYVDASKAAGRPENVVGWYHSHPGYGCWLSGIDCSTQMLNQQFQEPFLAVVVDPARTAASGKVEIGAFRTYPEGYAPPDEGPSEYQTIPLSKIEDFGVHAKQYYPLDMSFFKSGLDAALLDTLWNTYWVNTLSASPLISNRDYTAGAIADVAEKLERAEATLAQGGRAARFAAAAAAAAGGGGGSGGRKGGAGGGGGDEGPLARACRDAGKLSAEQVKGLASQLVKSLLFNADPSSSARGPRGGGGGGLGLGLGAGAAAAAAAGGGAAPMES